FDVNAIEFLDIRGNIPTRMKKLIESSEAHGLVLAKAALDRLLSSEEEEFQETRQKLSNALRQCIWMVLPLSLNPAAAAQGALAVEVKNSRQDIVGLAKKINQSSDFENVQK